MKSIVIFFEWAFCLSARNDTLQFIFIKELKCCCFFFLIEGIDETFIFCFPFFAVIILS